jgi:hypothetical protein
MADKPKVDIPTFYEQFHNFEHHHLQDPDTDDYVRPEWYDLIPPPPTEKFADGGMAVPNVSNLGYNSGIVGHALNMVGPQLRGSANILQQLKRGRP